MKQMTYGEAIREGMRIRMREDENVCIFDDVNVLAKEHDTITYEITTTLSPFIKKEII